MSWQFWKKRKKRVRVNEPITKGQSEGGGRVVQAAELSANKDGTDRDPSIRKHLAAGGELEIVFDRPDYERDQMVDTSNTPNYIVLTQGPIIHNVTGSIDWRGHDIGTKYGPARCNEACTEPHAFGVKTSPTTVSFERPCESADAGAAEWRARQKRG